MTDNNTSEGNVKLLANKYTRGYEDEMNDQPAPGVLAGDPLYQAGREKAQREKGILPPIETGEYVPKPRMVDDEAPSEEEANPENQRIELGILPINDGMIGLNITDMNNRTAGAMLGPDQAISLAVSLISLATIIHRNKEAQVQALRDKILAPQPPDFPGAG